MSIYICVILSKLGYNRGIYMLYIHRAPISNLITCIVCISHLMYVYIYMI